VLSGKRGEAKKLTECVESELGKYDPLRRFGRLCGMGRQFLWGLSWFAEAAGGGDVEGVRGKRVGEGRLR